MGHPALKVTKGGFYYNLANSGGFIEAALKMASVLGYYNLANSAGSGQSVTGYLRGRVIKTTKRFRVAGSLAVQDFDVPPTVSNCATPGVITYAATPCRNPNVHSSLPPCLHNY